MVELGKIEKPEARNFKGKRKLYVIPVLPFEDIASQFRLETVKIERFWGEVREKIEHFIATYGNINFLYVEGVDENEEAGLEFFEKFGKESNHFQLFKRLVDKGAKIKGIDKKEYIERSKLLFEEYSRSFSPEVKEFHEEFFGEDIDFEGWRKYLVEKIQKIQDEMNRAASAAIKDMPDEMSGVLIITDGRPVEFPEGVDVFQIRPPAFDEIEKNLRSLGI